MKLRSPALAVGVASMASRLLGYARDVLVANLLGAGPVAEALLVALRAPTALRRTLGEGGLNAAFTPLYIRLQTGRGDAAAANFARDALILAALALSALSAFLALGAGTVIYLMAPSLSLQQTGFEAARWWFVLMIPFMATATLASIAAAFLNAQRQYVIAALAPAAVNAALVCAYLAIPRISADLYTSGALMAVALSIGGLIQLGLTLFPLFPVLRKARSFAARETRASLIKAMRLAAPALAATASFQIMGIVASAAASQEASAVAWFYYAERLFQLPFSIAGVVIGSVVLTELAAHRLPGSIQTSEMSVLDAALTMSLAIGFPAAAGLFILAEPIVGILFGRGAFSSADIAGTARALAVLAPGLPAGIAARVLLQELLVREKAWLSALCGGASVAVTAATAFTLTPHLGVSGACAAVTAGMWTQCAALSAILGWKGWWRPKGKIVSPILKQLLATIFMAGLVVMLRELVLETDHASSVISRFLALGLTCTAGAIVYATVAGLVGGIPSWARGKQAGR